MGVFEKPTMENQLTKLFIVDLDNIYILRGIIQIEMGSKLLGYSNLYRAESINPKNPKVIFTKPSLKKEMV